TSHVLVPDFTMIACARAVTLAGLKPVFVDCDSSLLVDLDCVESFYANRLPYVPTPVVIAVHIYGRRVDMDKLHASVEGAAWVVEDLAEAHGIRPHPDTKAACWSFYKNKLVAGEEGGAVWFEDTERAEKARMLRCQGFTESHDFYHIPRGHNYRLANCL